MNFILLASLFLFLWVLCRNLKNHTRSMQQQQESFWERERKSNHIRKKPLEDLVYITIPFDRLPCSSHKDHEIISDCISTLTILSERKIVNLTCISNTELKLTYGTANITALSEYDQNYTMLVTTLQKWAETLYSLGDINGALSILEYAVSINCDITKTYSLLATIYEQKGDFSQISSLLQVAEGLSSPSGKIIVKKLLEAYPFLQKE